MGSKMNTFKSTVDWIFRNYYISKIFKQERFYFRMNFEEFVQNPNKIIEKINIETDSELSSLDYINQDNISFSGNPCRLSKGKIKLVYKDTWKNELSVWQKLFITFFSIPLLIKYKYL